MKMERIAQFKSNWEDFEVSFQNKLLTRSKLRYSLFKFWNDKLLNKISTEQFILIQFKVKISSGIFRSISHVQTVQIKDYKDLLEIFAIFWELRSEEYKLTEIESIIYNYKILELTNTCISKSKLTKFKIESKVKDETKKFNFKGYSLPCSMDISTWGNITYLNDECSKAIIYRVKSKAEYHVSLYSDYLLVDIKYKDKTIIHFKDIMLDNTDLSSFKRIIDKHEYLFRNGELILKSKKIITPFLSKIKQDSYMSTNFITMDLETRKIDNVLYPYCVSIYDGIKVKSFYLTDYYDSDDMLRTSINYLMKRKYHQHKVYLHNFSYFDGVFLLRILSSLGDSVKPIIRDSKIIDLKFYFNNNYLLSFRDSYLILPSSLKDLAIQFKGLNKGLYPYNFVNSKDVDLNYIGDIPNIKYFDKILQIEYINYKKQFLGDYYEKDWSLKKATILYCEEDAIILYKVIQNFNEKIYSLFRINILKCPTLSSLAFSIFRSNFLSENAKIPLITGDMFKFFKKGYTGGSVDVYKAKGENIYRYDVNSLYPYVMKNFSMPVGNPTYFEGDILSATQKDKNINPFGIFEVEVTAPKNLKIPLLQTRVKTKNGYMTISPLGTWSGVYDSGELFNSLDTGYTFKVLRGYLFEKGNIFGEFVDYFYNLKETSKKKTPEYIISKLILNSLFGRLGMSPEMEKHLILNSENALLYYKNYNITNTIDLKNGKELISFFDDISNNGEKDQIKTLNISIPISLTVTAAARVYMSKFKNMKDLSIYYTDTDSIDIDKPLDPKYVGSGLGKFKLENIFSKAIFLAPKVYGGITSEGEELVKVKGLKNPIKFDSLTSLLDKDSQLEITQDKWHRDFSAGHITIKSEIYTLKVTDNKRSLIYDINNKIINTIPLELKNGEIIED
jgi:hypothetical protein